MADEYSLPYRVQQLEKIGEKRDAQLDRIVDRQDEGYRRLERASVDISAMMTTLAQMPRQGCSPKTRPARNTLLSRTRPTANGGAAPAPSVGSP